MADEVSPRKLMTLNLIRRKQSSEWFSSEFGWVDSLAGATAFSSVQHMVLDPDWEVVKFVEVPM